MYRFLLSPRWLGWAALALLGAVAFVALGAWQFDRARRVTVPVPAADPAAVARPLADVLGPDAERVDGTSAGQLVTVSGTWDAAGQATVPGRVVAGQTGSQVVTPLRRAGASAVLVVRGFVVDGSPPPTAPVGPVTVTGWLAGPESVGDRPPVTGAGQVPAVSGAVFLNRLGYPVLDGYLGLTAASLPAASAGLLPVPLPDGGRGRTVWSWQSLGYAVQWNVFALGALAVPVIAARQQARERAGPTPVATPTGPTPDEITF